MIDKKIKKIIVFILLFILITSISGSFARIININHYVEGGKDTSTENIRKEKMDWAYTFKLYKQDGRWTGPLQIWNSLYTRYGHLVSHINIMSEGDKKTYWTRARKGEECHLRMRREFPWDWGTTIKGSFSPDKF